MSELTGWIAVDLDGTLADYSEWKGPEHIGAPVPLMVERVKAWRAEGKDIRIFTARVAHDEDGSVLAVIDRWCEEHLGERLPVTNTKDYGMVELWDDRCVQIIPNTGRRADGVDAPPRERVPEVTAADVAHFLGGCSYDPDIDCRSCENIRAAVEYCAAQNRRPDARMP